MLFPHKLLLGSLSSLFSQEEAVMKRASFNPILSLSLSKETKS